MAAKRVTSADFASMKAKGQKIVMLTAYDYSVAKLLDEAGIDCLLVGDSLGMVVLGYDSTLPVTMDDMIRHGAAVARGAKRALVVVDMPFMSYQVSVEEALKNAGRIMQQTGAGAVKVEGGREMAAAIKAITQAGIPAMGHVGLTPQSINKFGGYRIQGKTSDEAERLFEDAQIIEEAGAFGLVLECVPEALAARIAARLNIPTIGIGAGALCDGQVLVSNDMLGMFPDFKPKFVRIYADVGAIIKDAASRYAADVADGVFPDREHTPF